jgi:hypothetical protein
MKEKNKFIDGYEINYKDMLNSNINRNHRTNKNENSKHIIDKDTFESKKDHFNPSSWID